jgi:hypothetical protein
MALTIVSTSTMTWLKKTAVVLLLLIGLPVTLLTIADLLNPNASADDKSDATAALMILGLPPTILGGALILNLRLQHKNKLEQQSQDQEQLFIQLLQKNHGKLTTIQFAAEAQLSLEEAKDYLDEKARQLNGQFSVTDQGAIVYEFPL